MYPILDKPFQLDNSYMQWPHATQLDHCTFQFNKELELLTQLDNKSLRDKLFSIHLSRNILGHIGHMFGSPMLPTIHQDILILQLIPGDNND